MSDRSIYKETLNDDRETFNGLVRDYHVSLHGFVSRIIKDEAAAEDVVQDVFVNLWLNRKKISFDGAIRNYLYISAKHLSYNHIRSRQRLSDHTKKVEISESSVNSYLVEEEATRLLKDAITRLPRRTAEVIRLSIEGIKQEEIARQMDITVATVKLLKSRGILKLKEILGPFSFILSLWGML